MVVRDDTRSRLRRLRGRAAALLWAERALAAILPAGCVLLAYLALAAFGLASAWVFLLSIMVVLALLARGAWRFAPPARAQIDRRIEAASGLQHRPLAAIEDQVALGDPALFALHQAQLESALQAARAGGLRPVAAVADPFSLRAAAGLLLITGLIVAGAAAPQRLSRALALPSWPFPGPLVQAWVTPPAYTGQPPYLLATGAPVTALVGAHVGVILSGSTVASHFAGTKLAGPHPADGNRRAEAEIARSGRLTVGPWWHRLAAWDITAVPPTAPRLTLQSPMIDASALQLSFDAQDAYGLSRLAVALSPVGHPGALPAGADLPAQTGPGTATLDEAESPYAGLPVAVTLRGDNFAGITAVTPPQRVQLPASWHRDATAGALALIRQRLALAPDDTRLAGVALGALSRRPPSDIAYATDLQMAALAASLSARAARAAPAVDRMEALIRALDAGPSYEADQALAAASQALSDTLQKGGTQAQLDAAIQNLENALAAKLNAQPHDTPPAQGGRTMNADDLRRLAQQIANDERAGNMAKAQQEMAQLQQMMQQLQSARVMSPAQARRAAAAAGAQGALSQLIQGQGQELNKTGQGTATPGEQGQLRAALNALRQGLGQSGFGGPSGLDQAGRDMDEAQQAMEAGDNDAAGRAESRAITDMQAAAKELQDEAGTTVGFGGSMPATQTGANGTGQDQAIPGIDLGQSSPARRIQQDIMHRDSDPSLAPGTHDYLHRLLTP